MHVRNGAQFSSGLCLLLLALLLLLATSVSGSKSTATTTHENGNGKEHEIGTPTSNNASSKRKNAVEKPTLPVPCTCGIFLSGQFKKGSKAAPKGEPVVTEELDMHFAHNPIGQRQCANKCIENIIKYLPKSADIICSTIDRDCHKEKAYLFTKNYDSKWINSNMSAGRAFCCKDNKPYKCPLI